ncbi:MAG: Lrp/AsnC family transcriptional regulator [Actinomycetota bacterium]
MDDALEFHLLNDFQRDFPLCPAPFAELAARLGVGEKVLLGRLEKLRREGKISRVGAVFAPKRIGASTLAAMEVPPARLPAVAEAVGRFPEVNNSYERDHRYNLWFVVTAASEVRLHSTLGAIERAAGFPVMTLPLLEEYHADPGLSPAAGGRRQRAEAVPVHPEEPVGESERRLVSVLQEGLPLFIRPFALIAERIGVSEVEVMARIRNWLDAGAIKRFGVVVRHHEQGCTADAMLVQDIPDERVGEVGRALAEEPAISLCYRRPRVLPQWPYNLFCVIHGRDRAEVDERVAELRRHLGLAHCGHEVLFSLGRFKQDSGR